MVGPSIMTLLDKGNMKPIMIIIIVVSVVTVIVVAFLLYFLLQSTLEIDLIFINNFQAFYEGAKLNCTINCDCTDDDDNCSGGFPRMLTAFEEYREKPNTVVVNIGNNMRPSYHFSVNQTSELLKKIKFDAYTLGAMDLLVGLGKVSSFITNLKPTPFVSCNINADDEPMLAGLITKSVVINRDGYKIGIIGLLARHLVEHEIFDKQKLNFSYSQDCVDAEAKRLTKKENVFTIIVLSQCGFDMDTEMAESVHERVSIIVSARGNLFNGAPYEGEFADAPYPVQIHHHKAGSVLIVTTIGMSKYLGHLNVQFDKYGRASSWSGIPIFLNESVQQDPSCLREIRKYIKEEEEMAKKFVGRTEVDLNHERCTEDQCNIGDFVTDAMYKCHSPSHENKTKDVLVAIVLYPGYNIKATIAKGNITLLDLRKAFPGDFYVDIGEVKGATLQNAIAKSAQKMDGNSTKRHYFQVSHGEITYYLSHSDQSFIKGQTNLEVIDVIYPYHFYKVIVPSYLSRHRNKFFDSLRGLIQGQPLMNCLTTFLNNSLYKPPTSKRILIEESPLKTSPETETETSKITSSTISNDPK